METFNLAAFLDEKVKWTKQVFGEGRRTKGISKHIVKELSEIELDPLDLEEWVDVMLLAFDGASRAGYTGEEIVTCIIAKHKKNLARKWPANTPDDEATEHLK